MSRAAIRYAKAILELAMDANSAEAVFTDMQEVQSTVAGSKELRLMLSSPVIGVAQKKAALLEVFKNQSETTHSLINVLTTNQRTPILGQVAASYMELYNTAKGVKVATVTTAVPLTSELEGKVLAKVKQLTGSDTVSLENTIDADIIGGFILRVGDLQYNASIANQLGNIKREFSKSL